MSPASRPASDIGYLCRALKAPSLAAAAGRLAERARGDGWSHEEYLAACLEREVAARQSHGGEARIKVARFPARKTLEDFDYDHQRSVRREVIAHLAALDFVEGKENVVFLGPPGTGKTHLAIGLSIRACQAGHRVQFATAAEWVARLADAHAAGRLQAELVRLGRYPLIVIDEVGCIPRHLSRVGHQYDRGGRRHAHRRRVRGGTSRWQPPAGGVGVERRSDVGNRHGGRQPCGVRRHECSARAVRKRRHQCARAN